MTDPSPPHPLLPVAIITGASSGIGEETCRSLAGRFRTVLVARRNDRLIALQQSIRGLGGEALAIPEDVTSVGAAQRIVAEAIAHFGGFDAVVNNAGIFEVCATSAITAEHIERLWRLNVLAPMLLTQAALPHLIARRSGTIVNVSSVAAEASFAGCGVYSATKAALESWSRVLREELRATGVRVGVIAPGATATAAWPSG
ncbi:MAG: SDR family oxidoreductase, partial [Planctomycetes bacterium]|nr:SDR family oxidoreductase [Planctomycetota bacterium]